MRRKCERQNLGHCPNKMLPERKDVLIRRFGMSMTTDKCTFEFFVCFDISSCDTTNISVVDNELYSYDKDIVKETKH